MKRVATAVVLIPLVLLVVFRAPLWAFGVVVALVALWTTREYLDLTVHYSVEPFRTTTYFLMLLVFLAVLGPPEGSQAEPWPLVLFNLRIVALGVLIIAPFGMLAAGMRRESLAATLPGVAMSLFALPYIGVPMASLLFIRMGAAGQFFLFFILVVVWAGDIFAYYTGRSIGKHLMSPRISPKKTWEGAAASLVAALAFGVLLGTYAPAIGSFLMRPGSVERFVHHELRVPPLWVPVLAAVAINVAAQLGDLVESLIKRGAGVKDSGDSLPGHGGMLDRIDALLFAAPVAMLVFVLNEQYFFAAS